MKQKFKLKLLIGVLILAITTLHYFSGANNSPLHDFYRLLYFIPVILSAFHFQFSGALVVSVIVSLIYSPHILLSLGFKMETLNEFLDIALFFGVGIVTGILVEKKNIAYETLDIQLKKYVMLEKYTNSIIQSIRNGVVAVNKDLLITNINAGAKKILNSSEDCIGVNFIEVFSCCEDIRNNVTKALEENITIEGIETEIKKDNENRTIKVSLYPLNYENMNKGLVIIIEDISELKKIQKQIQRSDRLASVGQLATGVAHEIRNPLAIIKMIEQTLREELKSNSDVSQSLEIIDEEVERANKVIKSLMELGKPSKNEKVYGDVNLVLEDVMSIANKYTSQHNVTTKFEREELPPLIIDREQLKQAFINIIFNAVDAMPGGGEIQILSKVVRDKWIEVIFSDSGKGIEEEHLKKIFDPFFTTRDEGTGMGLAIVHRIVEEHNGIINVYSKPGEGTTFEIFFPLTGERGINDEKDFNSR